MNRSSRAQPLLALAVLMTLLVGLAVTVASPDTAEAQDPAGASMTLHASPIVEGQSFRTIAVSLEPGQTGLAALGAALVYDTDAVSVSSCAISEVGACNVVENGQVLVSIFNLTGLKANEQLLTINFEPVPGASGPARFEVVIKTALNAGVEQLADITGDIIEVDLALPAVGSITGTVLAADTATALFAIDVCATHEITGSETCTTSSGLGNWRIDDLPTGPYVVTASDGTRVYAPTTGTDRVVEGEIVSADDLMMTYFVEDLAPTVDDADDTNDTDVADLPTPEPAPESRPAIVPNTAIVVIYKASMTGRITGLRTEAPIEAAQVCATQPFVLHQSCATTDADGRFALAGLSTGNYWVDVVDPLGRFEQGLPKLVGVVGDEVTRTGVNITMRAAAE